MDINEEIHWNDGPARAADAPATVKRTPLPKLQLFVVTLVQFAEPITAVVIYPFINQFVRNTGITGGNERKTGYYAGVIESTFFIAEAATVVYWGRLSDNYGRRPVLMLGPLGLSIALFGFGMSTSYWPLVFFRFVQGMFNGNIGVARSVIAEITDSSNIADAFALNPIMWGMGTTIAPIIGGVLSSPAERWPDTFGKISLLKSHPYLLPCLVAASISMLSFIISFLGLKETLPSAIARNKSVESKRRLQKFSIADSSGVIQSPQNIDYGSIRAPCEVQEQPLLQYESSEDLTPPPIRELLTRPLLITYLNYTFLTFMDMSHCVLLPLMFSTPIPLGGLGLSPYQIGTIMGIFGLCNSVFQVNFLGRIIRRFGTRAVFRFSFKSFLVCISAYPLSSYFAKQAGRVDLKVYLVIVIQLMCQSFIFMAYGSMQIMVVEMAPNKASLGSVNGFAQMLGCISRSLAPSVASSLFSISLEHHLAGGNMVYFFLLGVAIIGIYLSSFLPRL